MSCITLLSDFGLQDATVASTKGILMQQCPKSQIVDISHSIEPFHLQQASYLLRAAYKNFPKNTCHLILFDIFYAKTPTMLLYKSDNQYFLAPNNGIIPLTFGEDINGVYRCFTIGNEDHLNSWINNAADIINMLEKTSIEELGLEEHETMVAPKNCRPIISGNSIECQVIHIDRFENVVLNITADEFHEVGKGRAFNITFMRDELIDRISVHYSAVNSGDKLCRFNHAGYLEIAINRGKAASLFGLKMKKEHQLLYNTIKIEFE